MIKTETFSADFVITATKQTLVRTGKSKRVRRNIRLRLVDDKSGRIPTKGYQTSVFWDPNHSGNAQGYSQWTFGNGRDKDNFVITLAENLVKLVDKELSDKMGGKLIVPEYGPSVLMTQSFDWHSFPTEIHKALYDLCTRAYNEQRATGHPDCWKSMTSAESEMPDAGWSPQTWDVRNCGPARKYLLRVELEKVNADEEYKIRLCTCNTAKELK